jgi:hypothetical protein
MNVLLLYPKFPDTFWSFKHALKFIHKRASLPPLGLLTVAAMLPQAWAKRLVDVNVRNLRDQDLAWADLVFVSGMITGATASRRPPGGRSVASFGSSLRLRKTRPPPSREMLASRLEARRLAPTTSGANPNYGLDFNSISSIIL